MVEVVGRRSSVVGLSEADPVPIPTTGDRGLKTED
jgi:hypothetical protein